ncbi:MAG: bacteriocin family protein [Acetobacteraceae bacterium]|nr:bacteriocin family protein [Acetobacteraceae bacterium]
MNHLFRELAPVSAAGWRAIEDEAKRTLRTMLAARKLADFNGPQGWEASAVGTGRVQPLTPPPAPQEGVEARLRRVLALVELRVPFEMRRSELDAIDRGAKDADTAPVTEAARKIAIAEDRAVFHGYAAAGIRGICETEPGMALDLGESVQGYPNLLARALNKLRNRGVGGPFAIALSEACYTGLTEATEAGYPVLEHVRRLVDGPIVWAPGLDGALVLSMRGGDFELTVGQDFSIGYLGHDAERVRLYIEESFTFWNISPHAAVSLAARQGGSPAA